MGILIRLESPLEILSSIAHSFPTHILRNLSSSFPISMLIFTGRCYVMLSFLLVFSLTNLMILSSIILHKSLSVFFFFFFFFGSFKLLQVIILCFWSSFGRTSSHHPAEHSVCCGRVAIPFFLLLS